MMHEEKGFLSDLWKYSIVLICMTLMVTIGVAIRGVAEDYTQTHHHTMITIRQMVFDLDEKQSIENEKVLLALEALEDYKEKQVKFNDAFVTYMKNDSGAGQFSKPGSLFKALTQPKPTPAPVAKVEKKVEKVEK